MTPTQCKISPCLQTGEVLPICQVKIINQVNADHEACRGVIYGLTVAFFDIMAVVVAIPELDVDPELVRDRRILCVVQHRGRRDTPLVAREKQNI